MTMKTIKRAFNIPVENLTDFEFDEGFVSLYASTKADLFREMYPKRDSKISRADAQKWYAAMANEEISFDGAKNYITVSDFIISLYNNNHHDLASALFYRY